MAIDVRFVIKPTVLSGVEALPALGQGREAGRWSYCFVNHQTDVSVEHTPDSGMCDTRTNDEDDALCPRIKPVNLIATKVVN